MVTDRHCGFPESQQIFWKPSWRTKDATAGPGRKALSCPFCIGGRNSIQYSPFPSPRTEPGSGLRVPGMIRKKICMEYMTGNHTPRWVRSMMLPIFIPKYGYKVLVVRSGNTFWKPVSRTGDSKAGPNLDGLACRSPPPMNDRNQCRRVKKYHWLSTAGLQFVLYLLVGLEKTATTPLGTRKSGPVRCRLSFKIQQNPGRGEKKGGGGSRNPPFIRRRNRGEPPTDFESVGQSENEYRWRHLPTE